MSKNCRRWSIPVPNHLNELLEEYIAKDAYQTKSEFVRAAIRDRLEKENQKLK